MVESCVDSLDAALASEAGGAQRLELCARLDVGGTTPDPSLVAAVVAAVRIPVVTMVRPRGGDFVYDTNELSAMARDVTRMRAAGAHGIVTGVLRARRWPRRTTPFVEPRSSIVSTLPTRSNAW